MKKRPLTATEQSDLRQALHVATLDALMTARRWEPGDLAFQGGTSLHLAHGSPRYSEDLDFLVRDTLKLDTLGDAIQRRLAGTRWLPPGTQLTVSPAKDGHNPHAFVVAIGGPSVIGAVRVKVELWQTAADALSAVKSTVATVRLSRGPAAGMQTFVPTADAREIYADKVFALAARPYLKPRDVFDMHWLTTQGDQQHACTAEDLRVRLATYPNETPQGWLEKAAARRQQLESATDAVMADLRRWLPSYWALDTASVQAMVDSAIAALDRGIAVMREIADRDADA